MKNILVLTPIYPGPDVPLTSTPIVHYFAKEWKKLGYNICVIVTEAKFPSIYYKIPKFILNFVERKANFVLNNRRLEKQFEYNLDGIKVIRIPLKKYIPHSTFSIGRIENHLKTITDLLKVNNFVPDYILGHWVNPQIYLEYRLKDIFHCKTSLVLHEDGSIIKKYDDYQKIIQSIDVWGYRSEILKEKFQQFYGITPVFRCYSGIPNHFYEGIIERDWISSNRYIFVGTLIKRKYPDVLIDALERFYNNRHYILNIYGSGIMEPEIIDKIRNKKNISLFNRVPRFELKNAYDESDIFIMISKNEVFGLVYLEAMARGCLVIASKNEGMQGIIKDGVNGFLCNSGDIEDLIKTLSKIENLSPLEKKSISERAIDTALNYSDSKVAEKYINSVINS